MLIKVDDIEKLRKGEAETNIYNLAMIYQLVNRISNPNITFEEKVKNIALLEKALEDTYVTNNPQFKFSFEPQVLEVILFYKYKDKNGVTVKVPLISNNEVLKKIDLSGLDFSNVCFSSRNDEYPNELKQYFEEKFRSYRQRENSKGYCFDFGNTNIKGIDFRKIYYVGDVRRLVDCNFNGVDLSKANIDYVEDVINCNFEECNLNFSQVKHLFTSEKSFSSNSLSRFRDIRTEFNRNNFRDGTIEVVSDYQIWSQFRDYRNYPNIYFQAGYINLDSGLNIVAEKLPEGYENYLELLTKYWDSFEKMNDQYLSSEEKYGAFETYNNIGKNPKFIANRNFIIILRQFLSAIRMGTFVGCSINGEEISSEDVLKIKKGQCPDWEIEFLSKWYPHIDYELAAFIASNNNVPSQSKHKHR